MQVPQQEQAQPTQQPQVPDASQYQQALEKLSEDNLRKYTRFRSGQTIAPAWAEETGRYDIAPIFVKTDLGVFRVPSPGGTYAEQMEQAKRLQQRNLWPVTLEDAYKSQRMAEAEMQTSMRLQLDAFRAEKERAMMPLLGLQQKAAKSALTSQLFDMRQKEFERFNRLSAEIERVEQEQRSPYMKFTPPQEAEIAELQSQIKSLLPRMDQSTGQLITTEEIAKERGFKSAEDLQAHLYSLMQRLASYHARPDMSALASDPINSIRRVGGKLYYIDRSGAPRVVPEPVFEKAVEQYGKVLEKSLDMAATEEDRKQAFKAAEDVFKSYLALDTTGRLPEELTNPHGSRAPDAVENELAANEWYAIADEGIKKMMDEGGVQRQKAVKYKKSLDSWSKMYLGFRDAMEAAETDQEKEYWRQMADNAGKHIVDTIMRIAGEKTPQIQAALDALQHKTDRESLAKRNLGEQAGEDYGEGAAIRKAAAQAAKEQSSPALQQTNFFGAFPGR